MIPIFDGHNDTLLDLERPERGAGRSFFVASDQGHIDLPRARQGGFGGGFFACFTPSPRPLGLPDPNELMAAAGGYAVPLPDPLTLTDAQRTTFALAARLFRLEADAEGALKVVRSADELQTCLDQGVLAAIFHIEGADAIDPDLNTLDVLYQAGLRSLGLVWSRPNAFGHGVPFEFPASPDIGPGLTDLGQELVRACNRLGVMIDLSHLNEQGFWDVAALSDAPLVATHSNAHALCASSRNLTDQQLDAIRASDGMVGVNFAVSFLRPDGRYVADTPLTLIVDHIDYLVARLGIDRVGLGSDFDGARVPADLGDVAGLPRLMDALQARGYDDAALRKLAHENWVRVLRQTWR